jgi:thiol-disulfide isomerase/thioredoxin
MRALLHCFALALTLLLPASASQASGELKPFLRGSWQQLLAAHRDRPTIVHFWGVTCGPCKVELPRLGQFAKAHPGIDVVTISADLVPDRSGATRAMLAKSGLGLAENWIFGDGFVERLRFEIDPAWQGDIPRSLLISRTGAVTTIEGSAELQQLEAWSGKQRDAK